MSANVKRCLRVAAASLAILLLGGNADMLPPQALTAGSYTVAAAGAGAFNIPIPQLDKKQAKSFAKGHEQFNEKWVLAPDMSGVWGLGPTFNEDRCAHCHIGNGRAAATADGEPAAQGVLLRLSVAGSDKRGGPLAHPHYGEQLQNRSVLPRIPVEGQAIVRYEPHPVSFADGEQVVLRKPRIEFRDLQFGDLGSETLTSLRVAQQMVGMGLLEAVPEEDILAIARAQEQQGVSGRPNSVWDIDKEKMVLGRFGWKANQPNIAQQTAAAFMGDIGATSYMFQDKNCPPVQVACKSIPSAARCGGQGGCEVNDFRPEVVSTRLNNITFYLHTLGVPARRDWDDPVVQRGERLFDEARCGTCHVPELRTGAKPLVPSMANLSFKPYTDLLLHDMGEELADGRPDHRADGREWRTAPLWGIGLIRAVNGHSDLLHDGRARNVSEAILWHGGEAEAAREAYRNMPRADRAALLRFIESL